MVSPGIGYSSLTPFDGLGLSSMTSFDGLGLSSLTSFNGLSMSSLTPFGYDYDEYLDTLCSFPREELKDFFEKRNIKEKLELEIQKHRTEWAEKELEHSKASLALMNIENLEERFIQESRLSIAYSQNRQRYLSHESKYLSELNQLINSILQPQRKRATDQSQRAPSADHIH